MPSRRKRSAGKSPTKRKQKKTDTKSQLKTEPSSDSENNSEKGKSKFSPTAKTQAESQPGSSSGPRRTRNREKPPPPSHSKRSRNLISDGSTSDSDDDGNDPPGQQHKKAKNDDLDDDFRLSFRCPHPYRSLKDKVRMEECERTYTPTTSGIIKSLRMYNFMCHDNFHQEWHPNLNFITGENGSGKSALLSGILIGLGAKAILTSRTKSISSLIKKGKDHARTEIILVNDGSLSNEKYGQEVTIERTLSKNGSSNYRIKSDVGQKYRPLERNELDCILISLNIQLDNPVAILNQEVAKNFLRTKDPKAKYTLFTDGTLLSKLFTLLSESKSDLDASEKNLEFHKGIITEMRTLVHKLQKKMQEFTNLTNIKSTLTKLNLELVWSYVYDEEQLQQQLKAKIENHSNEVKFCSEKVKALTEKRTQVEREADKAEETQRRTIFEKLTEKERELEKTRSEAQKTHMILTDARSKLRGHKPVIKKLTKEVSGLKKLVDNLKSRSVEDEERLTRVYLAKKEELKERKDCVVRSLSTLKEDGDRFRHGADSARAQLGELQDRLNGVQRVLETKKQNVKRLKSPLDNKYSCYGANVEALMAKIAANSRGFSKPPRGPLGSHLTLKDPRYSQLIETVMGKFLRSFLVNTHEDVALLKKLIDQVWGSEAAAGRKSVGPSRPQILQCPFSDEPYDMTQGVARIHPHPTLLDQFEVENDDAVVINALCDYQDAEKIVLFESNLAAAGVMKDAIKCPRTLKCGYTLEHFRFHPAPHYAARKLPKHSNLTNLLRTSKRAQIEQIQREIDDLQAQIDEMKPALDSSKINEAKLRKQYNQRAQEIDKNKKELVNLDKELRENENRKYTPVDIASHEEEIKSLERDIRTYTTSSEDCQALIENLTPKHEELEAKKEEIEEEMLLLVEQEEAVLRERERVKKDVEKISILIRRFSIKIKDSEKGVEPVSKQLESSVKELERKREQAQSKGERVASERPSESVAKEVTKLSQRIKVMETHLGSMEKTQKELEKRKKELDDKVKDYRPIYRSFCILRELIESQLAFFFKKRAEISNSIGITYNCLASQRGYKGQLMVDHDKQELHYFIHPDKTSSGRTDAAIQPGGDRQAKKTLNEYSLGLSGGERSFSTICFIMSLWQVMECPFYMLDEFDVFMDAFNRKASQQALMQHARSFKRNQFFLFSQLELFEVPEKEEATTLRLKAARSGAAIPVSPAAVGDNEAENVDPTCQPEPVPGPSKPGGSGIIN